MSGRDADPGAVPLVPGAATARERGGAVVVALPVITSPLRLAAGRGRQKARPNYFPFQIAYYRCSILFGHDPLRQWFWRPGRMRSVSAVDCASGR